MAAVYMEKMGPHTLGALIRNHPATMKSLCGGQSIPAEPQTSPLILTTGTVSETVNINQQQNTGQWNSLGEYYFDSNGSVTITAAADGTDTSTCADAVWFKPIENNPAASLNSVAIEGPESVDEKTSTNYALRAYYSDGTNHIITPDSCSITTGASLAEITDQGDLNTYEVAADGSVGLLFSYTEGQSTWSDEIQVAVLDTDTTPPAPTEIIMDNGDPNTYYTGRWKQTRYPSFGSRSHYCPRRSEGTYTFSNQLYGEYQVSFRWIAKGTNSDVKVEIFDGDTLLGHRQRQPKGKRRSVESSRDILIQWARQG